MLQKKEKTEKKVKKRRFIDARMHKWAFILYNIK